MSFYFSYLREKLIWYFYDWKIAQHRGDCPLGAKLG